MNCLFDVNLIKDDKKKTTYKFVYTTSKCKKNTK